MPRIDGSKDLWINSTSKSLLRSDVLRGIITKDSDPKEIYDANDEHKKWVFDNWKDALDRLIAADNRDRNRMQDDILAYGHDLAIVKESRPTGEVAWHRSPAYLLLKRDVDKKRHTRYSPKQLWLKREEYQQFDLKSFRKHIYQEVDSRPKRAIRFEKKKKSWLYPELHVDHPRLQENKEKEDEESSSDSSNFSSSDSSNKDGSTSN